MALAKLVWKGKELLEIVREPFEGELDNLWLLLFTLILNFLCSKSTYYLASCSVVCLNAYCLSLVKYAIQNIAREIGGQSHELLE
jgi:hypothetical protein